MTPNPLLPTHSHSPKISLSPKRRRRFRLPSLRQILLPLACLALAALLLASYAEKRLAPKIASLAEQAAMRHLTETVNREIGALAADGLLRYDSMVKTIRDETGEVIYLEVDTAMLGKAKSTLVSRISEALEREGSVEMEVPFGLLTGWNLFSERGIRIRFRLFPIEFAEGEIYTVLEDCGINQTRHLIQVKVSASLMAVLPQENIEVETEVTLPLGERVLVGEVPEIYLDTLGVN